jgi:uncharacterized protein (TIGR04255 family)
VTDAPRPPVTEVVLSVAMARQAALSGPQLPSILGNWFDDHSRVESVPPYEMPAEAADLAASLQQLPSIQMLTAASSLTRYWLISEDDHEVVQVQPNYLALNWRHRNEDSKYPGYESMRQRFLGLLESTHGGLQHYNGNLSPSRAELSYINTIHPSEIWSSHDNTDRLLRISLTCRIFL